MKNPENENFIQDELVPRMIEAVAKHLEASKQDANDENMFHSIAYAMYLLGSTTAGMMEGNPKVFKESFLTILKQGWDDDKPDPFLELVQGRRK